MKKQLWGSKTVQARALPTTSTATLCPFHALFLLIFAPLALGATPSFQEQKQLRPLALTIPPFPADWLIVVFIHSTLDLKG
jgi:hypothetical protein